MIIDEYLGHIDKFKTQFQGVNFTVLMQVGSFYELYSIDNEIEKVGADIYKIGELCNLQVSRKNKSIIENSRQNPLMAGFNMVNLNKYVGILLQHGYTIIIVKQVTEPPNCERAVTDIISPGTYVDGASVNNYLMSIYCELESINSSCGIGIIDCITGKNWLYEFVDTDALDEVYKVLQMYKPKEVLFHNDNDNVNTVNTTTSLLARLGLHNSASQVVHIFENDSHKKIGFQNELLGRIFQTGKLSGIEYCNLERMPFAATAYTSLLLFTYEHSETLLKRLETPTICFSDHYLTLHYNTIEQLNIVTSSGSTNSLTSILNRCQTSFGRRLFQERLFHPIYDQKVLEARYDEIDKYIRPHPIYSQLLKPLGVIVDLERVGRRISLNLFNPIEFVNFDNSLNAISTIFSITGNTSLANQLNQLKNYISTQLDINECSKYFIGDIRNNCFVKGLYADIDALETENEQMLKLLAEVGAALESKLDFNDRDLYHFVNTKKRSLNLDETRGLDILMNYSLNNHNKQKHKFTIKAVSSSSSSCKIGHPIMDEISQRIVANRVKISALCTEYYTRFLQSFDVKALKEITLVIAEIDLYSCCARNAIEFRYCRPTFQEDAADAADAADGLTLVGMRHPMIERLNDTICYSTNDVSLSKTNNTHNTHNTHKRGMLLYGVNAAGKSSFMKAIGCNIILAQAGMYAAAQTMHFKPYRHIFTRIQGNDNIFLGQSSFAVEMMELRNILKWADKRSLVLGDELCHGTESISAISIVYAGLVTLNKIGATYIFATHLHELVDMIAEGKENVQTNLGIYHLDCSYDEVRKTLIYNRVLKEGPGSSIYGLEVCKSLGLEDSFLTLANQVRQRVLGHPDLLLTKRSNYNKGLYMGYCHVCKTNLAEETHHIKYQSTATSEGYIDHFHKDARHNLAPLCQKCHDLEHTGKIAITGYQDTTSGRILKVDRVEKEIKEKTEKIEKIEMIDLFHKTYSETLHFKPFSGWMEKKGNVWKPVRQIQKRINALCTLISIENLDVNHVRPMFL